MEGLTVNSEKDKRGRVNDRDGDIEKEKTRS